MSAIPRTGGTPALRRLLAGSRPLRFVIVGGLNTMACYLVFAALVWNGIDYKAANLASLVFGICLNFVLQGRFVFGDSDPRRFVRFVLFWCAIFVVQTAIIGLLTRAGIGPLPAGLIVLPGTAIVSYVVQKRLVFRTGEKA